MQMAYIESSDDLNQSKECSVTWGLATEFVQEYKLEVLKNES